eukprot:TRINITY_DN2667_c0_g1_i1.p1 TRINITY_DN2667_c0_g1~~TRINITY_DN2667_c0_g1_i1.p1  ORF type:complete len:634 (-),score=134.19 TRINITY_DN2667_c0_g1_i1:497-2398(-)
MRVSVLLAAFALLCACASAFYLPGVAPVDYPKDAKIDLKVNKMTSVTTQLPYEYYSLPFCKPDNIESVAENLGEVLSGDRIETSKYEIYMKVPETCKVLCQRTYTKKQSTNFAQKIKEQYRVNWILDGLPAATPKILRDLKTQEVIKTYELGFPLGFMGQKGHPNQKENTAYLNNHVTMKIYYHSEVQDGTLPTFRIVGFDVYPRSVAHQKEAGSPSPKTCAQIDSVPPQAMEASENTVVFTYDVIWEEKNIPWSSRWDVYLQMTDSQIHWFSIINSVMIVLFLTGMIAMIMTRTIRQDLIRYNQPELLDDPVEESGWKMVHGDVFRAPNHPLMLSISVGSGVHILATAFASMIFAVLGFLSPANRGGLLTAIIVLYVFMGVLAGYSSSRFYKMFKGQIQKRCTFMTAMFYPGIIFLVFFILNFFIWGKKSSGAVPFTTLLALLGMWFGICTPLVYLGSYFGYRKRVIENPVRTNQIARQVPELVWYLQPVPSILMAGILPFGAVFIELFYILSSIWLHQFYYVFGFLFIVLLILVITCAEITIVMCYFQLCSEDYHWWWRSFLTSGASALYMFLYSLFYFFNKLEIHSFVSTLLFFSYTFIMCLVFFLMTGTVGFLACFWFVRKIYAAVKVE